jgi:hypothetical protein
MTRILKQTPTVAMNPVGVPSAKHHAHEGYKNAELRYSPDSSASTGLGGTQLLNRRRNEQNPKVICHSLTGNFSTGHKQRRPDEAIDCQSKGESACRQPSPIFVLFSFADV